ncbi:hypothetical protein BC834DRAFT_971075 [Gloeopeniophorella convolvens]|nr:hypothetical protein BC834DRAFT_971075 [Gloeopeniophorella convolvens]
MSTTPSSGVGPPLDLSQLNITQLRVICKEKRIPGYSRLGKPALIARLVDSATTSAPPPPHVDSSPAPPSKLPPLQDKSSSAKRPQAVVPKHLVSQRALAPPASVPGQEINSTHIVDSSDAHICRPPVTPQVTASVPMERQTPPQRSPQPSPVASAAHIPRSKRPAPALPSGDTGSGPPAKKTRANATQVAQPAIKAPVSARGGFKVPALPPGVACAHTSTNPSAPSGLRGPGRAQDISKPGKRFKPLAVTLPPSAAPINTKTQVPTLDKGTQPQSALWHLDFASPEAPPSLSPITFPPSLTQRRLVEPWAIILSGLSNKERRQCCLVSKLVRYAVFSSAYYKLSKDFSGRRLALMLEQYGSSARKMNFWPYLRQRKQEVLQRKAALASSFIAPLFRGPNQLVSALLWVSPDHEKQLTIAIRYLLTRLWFSLSTTLENPQHIQSTWLHETITSVTSLADGEIWALTTYSALTSHMQTLHVLEATCEVLGAHADSARLRGDWAAYVDGRVPGLRDAMRWADHGEYERGVSRHWDRRTAQMGAQGGALRAIAERYALACVVENSVSGSWMSAPEMAQEFAGLAPRRAGAAAPVPAKAQGVSLYLPAHHHVESVHLTTSGGRPLHPALAVVQTPAREYYILRDNGMEVGCEEVGVAGVWMRVLGCDSGGERVVQAPLGFAELRAYIQDT